MGFWRRGNYEANTIEMITNHIRWWAMFQSGTWYVGLTANPVQSLEAHHISIYEKNFFHCWDIPQKDGISCKEAILAMEGYQWMADAESDYLDNTYPNLYIYLFPVTYRTVPHIDTSGFTPLKSIPKPPIVIRYFDRRESETTVRFDDSFDATVCEKFLAELKEKLLADELCGMLIKARGSHYLELEFGESGCCTITYDSQTSQSGAFQGYRSENKSRKLVTLFTGRFPEYMLCRDMEELSAILRYFLLKDRKPGKRQNVKWVSMTAENDFRRYHIRLSA